MEYEETDYEKFLRFSKAIANDMPMEDGDFLGPALCEKYENNFLGLAIELVSFLQEVGFSEDEALSCFKLAVNNSFYLAFNSDIVYIEPRA
jgi:hypothetical protein